MDRRLSNESVRDDLVEMWPQSVATSISDRTLFETNELNLATPTFAESGRDSTHGRFAHVPDDILEVFRGVEKMRSRVRERLADGKELSGTSLQAMYRRILTGGKYYLEDESEGGPNEAHSQVSLVSRRTE